mmetsp:Transcript_19409/g.21419  ORF Transcript_19409/g.21419 Transcript_19409/m.21419 type:complete len:118 (+) Transcript_19409:108-461(+)
MLVLATSTNIDGVIVIITDVANTNAIRLFGEILPPLAYNGRQWWLSCPSQPYHLLGTVRTHGIPVGTLSRMGGSRLEGKQDVDTAHATKTTASKLTILCRSVITLFINYIICRCIDK